MQGFPHKCLVVASQLRLTSSRDTSQQVLGLHARQRSRAQFEAKNTQVGRAVTRPGRRRGWPRPGQQAASNISQMLNRRATRRGVCMGRSPLDAAQVNVTRTRGAAGGVAEDVLPGCRLAFRGKTERPWGGSVVRCMRDRLFCRTSDNVTFTSRQMTFCAQCDVSVIWVSWWYGRLLVTVGEEQQMEATGCCWPESILRRWGVLERQVRCGRDVGAVPCK